MAGIHDALRITQERGHIDMAMTISITCDGCGTTVESSTQFDSGANEIESSLEEGWVHDSAEDFCPSCAPRDED